MGIKSSFLFCLLLFLGGAKAYTQQKTTITGSVVNESGQPLSGTTITESSTTNTTLLFMKQLMLFAPDRELIYRN